MMAAQVGRSFLGGINWTHCNNFSGIVEKYFSFINNDAGVLNGSRYWVTANVALSTDIYTIILKAYNLDG